MEKNKWQLQPISYHQLVKHGSWTKLMPIWKWNPLSKFLEGLLYQFLGYSYKSSEWKTTHVTIPCLLGDLSHVHHFHRLGCLGQANKKMRCLIAHSFGSLAANKGELRSELGTF